MKKTLLAVACFLGLLAAAPAQIVITEIMYNPPESGTDSLEYIELYNNGNNTVDLEGWSMTGVTHTFSGVTLGAGQYLLLAKSAASMQIVFNKTAVQWNMGALDNAGEIIAVLDNNGATVDEVTFDDTAPWPTLPDGQGPSLVLCDYNSDNTNAANWQAATTPTGSIVNGIEILANPGAASDCSTSITANPDNFNAPQTEISEFDVLANDFLPAPNDVTVSIVSAPQHGTAGVNPDNTLSYEPDAGYCGSDELTYEICDNGGCDEAVVSITVLCFPAYSIAQVTTENADGVADSIGVGAQLTGTVYGVNTRASLTGIQFTLVNDDNSAGINVFNPTNNFGYTVQEGDRVTVRGEIGQFNGLTQIVPVDLALFSQNNPIATPPTVIRPDESTESRLIRISNLHLVDPAEWATGVGPGFNARAVSDDHPQDTILIRVDNDVTLFNDPAPLIPFNLTGLGGQFDNMSPFTGAYQIQPRYSADLEVILAAKEADFSANVSLTPNPAGEMLFLQTDLAFDRLYLLAADGRLLRTLENPAFQERISVAELAGGVYFLRFEKDGAQWTTRFVKL